MADAADLLESASEKFFDKTSPQEIAEFKNVIHSLTLEIAALDPSEAKNNLGELKFGALQNTLLHLAAKFGEDQSVATILQLIKNDKNLVDARNNGLFTPLHFAARNGHIKSVQLLIQSGADVNPVASVENRKWVPIHYAAQFGHADVVEFLIKSGVDKETKTGFGLTPLVVGAEFGHAKVVELMLSLKAEKNVQTIEDNHRMTALHYAAVGNFKDVLLLLLNAGIDKNKQTNLGFSALDFAAKSNNAEIVKILLSWGTADWEHALSVAKDNKSAEAIQVILEYVKAKKNLFDVKFLKIFSADLVKMLKFDKNNLAEPKIILPNNILLNAHGIVGLRQGIGLFSKSEMSLLQIAEKEQMTDLANAIRELKVLIEETK